jgi:predicted alpha/beta hydrolase family esterase
MNERGVEVRSPDFPDTNEPKLKEWLATTRKNVKKFDEEWILAGHSLGCPTILRLLETFERDEKVGLVIMVAGFAKDLGIQQTRNFVDKDFDWKKIKSKAKRFVIINSDNDPYIELSEGKRMAKLLGAEFMVEHNAGHINEGSGFTEYPRLLQIIDKLNP